MRLGTHNKNNGKKVQAAGAARLTSARILRGACWLRGKMPTIAAGGACVCTAWALAQPAPATQSAAPDAAAVPPTAPVTEPAPPVTPATAESAAPLLTPPATEPVAPVVTPPATEPAAPAVTPPATEPVAPVTAPQAPATEPAAPAVSSAPEVLPEDGEIYLVSRINLHYTQGSPQPVPVGQLGAITVQLAKAGDTFVKPRKGLPGQVYTLANLSSDEPRKFAASALKQSISQAVVQYLNSRGIVGVIVSPDIEGRKEGSTALDIAVTIAVVREVHTVASGERFPASQKRDNPAQQWIVQGSPVVAEDKLRKGKTDLLQKNLLDDYVLDLNRYPGRHVDVAVSPSDVGGVGGVSLDYLVAETKPWFFTAQVSNTGTRETTEWRERVAYTNYQFSGHNDIFSLDYNTAGLSDSNVLTLSYEAPLGNLPRTRFRAYFTYDDFVASDVGFAGQNFKGEEYIFGLEASTNLLQKHDFFIDGFGGVRYQSDQVKNDLVGSLPEQGRADFVMPYIGLRASRQTETVNSLAAVTLIGGYTPAKENTLNKLRFAADPTFIALQLELSRSFYLEPIFDPTGFKSGTGSLAHELALSARGQSAFGYRLIPQNEEVAGGLYSVRGYPESEVAGDTALILSAEYRYHIAKGLKVQPDPRVTPLFGQPFRFAPQQPYGTADWDLIARGFVDGARVVNSDRYIFEDNNTLISTGVGLEFLYKQNVDIRVDWGVALHKAVDASGEIYSPGDNRFHFSFTFNY